MIEALLQQNIQQFIKDHESDDPFTLGLKYKEVDGVPFATIAEQISGRQKAHEKLPSWYSTKDIIYPPKLSMEQCSSEQTALYKAPIVRGSAFIDMTGGAGVDTWALAKHFKQGLYVEQNEHLATLAAHNFKKLGATNINVVHGDGIAFLQHTDQQFDCIYIDPARRDKDNNKVFFLEDCTPDVIEHFELLLSKSHTVLIKTSPMLDISQSLKALQHVKEVHIVAIKNDCKEVLYLIDKAATGAPTIHTINFSSTGEERLTFDTPAQPEIGYSKPSEFLYEPNAAIMKSGRMDDLAAHFPLAKLHPNTQLFTSREHLTNFPGRTFRIEQIIPYSKKELKKAVADGKANITVRNFKDDVKRIRKKTGLKDGGKVYLFACTDVNNKPIIIKCFKT